MLLLLFFFFVVFFCFFVVVVFLYRVAHVCEIKIDKYRPCESMSPLFTSEIRQPPTSEHPVSLVDDIYSRFRLEAMKSIRLYDYDFTTVASTFDKSLSTSE